MQKLYSLLDRGWPILQERMNRAHNRSLIRRMAACGPGFHVYGRMKVSCPEKLTIGENVHIAENAHIRAEGTVSIGDNSHISRNLVLYSVNHDYNGACLPYDDKLIEKPVVIERNVWIGMNVCIAPGTTIGEGAIVGMGCVVFGNVPARSIIGASAWRVLKARDEQHYHELEAENRYGGPNGRLYIPGAR